MKKNLIILTSILAWGCCSFPKLTGTNVVSRNIWPCELTFLTDSTVKYIRSYGWGVPIQKADAKWTFIDFKHIHLKTEFTHQNIPIDIQESQLDSDSMLFVLFPPPLDSISIWLCSETGQEIPFIGREIIIPREDIERFKSFSIVARIAPESYVPPLNNDEIRTAVYTIQNLNNNVFRISPPKTLIDSWLGGFQYQELDHRLKIKRCGKQLIWLDTCPMWNWSNEHLSQ